MYSGAVAEIKSIIYQWRNREPEPGTGATHFAGSVQLLIGEPDDDHADSFDLIVCSPSRLVEYADPENWNHYRVLPGGNVYPLAGVWLMKSWSRSDFEAAVYRLVAACGPGPDFGVVAARIGRLAPWEYDYRYDDQVNRAASVPEISNSFWHD